MSDLGVAKLKLSKIIRLHNDFPAMIKEVACDITGKVVFEQIEKEARALDVEVPVAAKSIVSSQVKRISELSRKEISIERDVEGLLSTVKLLLKKGTLAQTDISKLLLSDPLFLSLPLTALWKFICVGVVSFEQILKSIHDEEGGSLLKLLEDLMKLILHSSDNSDGTSIVSEALGALVNLSYNLKKSEYHSLSKSASNLLDSVTEHLLDFVLESFTEGSSENTENRNSQVLNIYELLMNNLKVTSQALQNYCSSQLIYVLTHQPNLHVTSVLKSQEKWRSTLVNPVLSLLMQKLVIVLGYEAALHSLNTVVTNDEVNWGCVLTLVATTINSHKFAVSLLKTIIEKHIRKGCDDQDMEFLVIGFIFARHASQEGCHLFPSYSQWFSGLFSTESGSPASHKQSFVFLIQFLTDLVPHEPVYCLRTHLTSHIFVPKGCQTLLHDYYNLARARLQEMKDNLESHTVSRQNVEEKDKVVKEVEMCIEQFSHTGKIPHLVLEASIFRKPYYMSSFLPTLLAPRTLPDEPDATSKFISIMHSSGKIPANMYKAYTEECQKFTSDLLSGIFINVEEEMVVEEPITELSNILNELLDASVILPILSRISHKIEEITKASDLKMKSKTHLVLNPRMCNFKLVSYQVIQEFVNIFEKVCFSQKQREVVITKPDWIPQFLSLLSSSITLQLSLFNYLLYHLEYGQHHKLSVEKIQIQGALISEICTLEGLFSSVVDSSSMNQSPVPFVKYFLQKLERNMSTKQACVHTCCLINYWLQWHIENGTEGKTLALLPEKLMDLYCFLAPRINLIVTEEEDELTMATVYSSLNGQGVPSYARLYFDQIRSLKQNGWLSLEKWISLELRTVWEKTPLDVRLCYLQCRVERDFIFCGSAQNDSEKRIAAGEVVTNIIHTLLESGVKDENSSEMIMLLQRLAHLYPDADICLLEDWHFNLREKPFSDKNLFLFINLCRCLPPPYFLPSKRVLQLSGVLEQLVHLLQNLDQGLVLNLCNTTYIVSCLLHAAKDSCVKGIHIEKCLQSIRRGVIFHWDSLKSMFEDNIHIIESHKCLETLRHILNDPAKNFSRLCPEESGLLILSLCLKSSSVYETISGEISSVRTSFLKWLFAYIGIQQMQGSVPFFPESNDTQILSEKDEKIICICKRELKEYLATSDPLKLVEEMFPPGGEPSVSLRRMTTACILIVLLEFASDKTSTGKKVNRNSLEAQLLEILLHCYIYLGQFFDSGEGGGHGELPDTPVNKTMDNKDLKYSSDLGHISALYQRILSLLCKIPPNVLCNVSEGTIAKCEGELHSTLKQKMQCYEN
ncbi:uncharacterized protein LOC135213204 [Macrobrachium nipponense]|uniref:uncharacterized protein LOC135213204 n=1 Tax=Macrobrachium nipponense TaxID=159736 RepID=UPI0030C7A549